MSLTSHTPEAHYNRITDAWRFLLGENLHYGYFSSPSQPLDEATTGLSDLMLHHAQLKPDHHVLDVGCGIGTPALHLVETIGCRVTGISTSDVGLELARTQAKQRGLQERATFVHADGMNNGLPSSSFDCVWALESSHLMSDKPALISEAHRVLKPGGRLVLCDIITHGTIPLRTVLKFAREFRLLEMVFGEAKMASLEEYAQWSQDSGLSVESTLDITEQTLPTFDRWAENAHANKDESVERFGTESWEHFMKSCDTLRNMWNDNILGYGLIVATKPS